MSAVAYHCGGDFGSGTVFATTEKTIFDTEASSAIPAANLSLARGVAAALGNPSVAGYIAGGYSGTTVFLATADKLTFASETTAAQGSADLSLARYGSSGMPERSTKGYFFGGFTGAGLNDYTVVADKFVYSTEVTSSQVSANLTYGRARHSSITEGATKGYIGGGFSSSTFGVASDKITFSTDTNASQTTADLTLARGGYSGVSDGSTKGYWTGGSDNSGFTNRSDKVTFSTDVASAMTTQTYLFSNENGSSNGAIAFTAAANNVRKWTFATDLWSSTLPGATLPTTRFNMAGVSTAAL